MAIVSRLPWWGWGWGCMIGILLIQDVAVARPIVSVTSSHPGTDVGQGATISSSTPSESTSSPSTSASSSSSSSSSEPPTHSKTLDLSSSLLKTIFLQVLEERGQDDAGAKNKSASSRDSLAEDKDAESLSLINKSRALPKAPQEDDDNTSTLTLVAIIALVVAVFIFGLFVAVLCPHKIHPKLLFQCPCLLSPHRQQHKHCNNNNCHHHHHHNNDSNNSTANIVNESMSSSSATSNQNFNLNDNNCCNCLKHNGPSTCRLQDFLIHSNYLFNDNQNTTCNSLGRQHQQQQQIYPTGSQSNSNFHQSPIMINADEAISISGSLPDNGIMNEIRRQHESRGSIHSNKSNDRFHTPSPFTQENKMGGHSRQLSRNSIVIPTNNTHHHHGDDNNINIPTQENKLSSHGHGNGNCHAIGKQQSRGSLHSNGHDFRQNGAGTPYNTVRSTPKTNPTVCPSETSSIIMNAPNNRLHSKCCVRSSTESHTHNHNNIILYPTESHSGGSHENANLDRETDSEAVSHPRTARIRDKRRGSHSTHSHSCRPSTADAYTSHTTWGHEEDHSSCPHCDAGERVHIERTWVDQDNRQHSAL